MQKRLLFLGVPFNISMLFSLPYLRYKGSLGYIWYRESLVSFKSFFSYISFPPIFLKHLITDWYYLLGCSSGCLLVSVLMEKYGFL